MDNNKTKMAPFTGCRMQGTQEPLNEDEFSPSEEVLSVLGEMMGDLVQCEANSLVELYRNGCINEEELSDSLLELDIIDNILIAIIHCPYSSFLFDDALNEKLKLYLVNKFVETLKPNDDDLGGMG